MNIALTPELEAFVNKKKETEGYDCISEIVHEALWLLEERDWVRERRLENLRREIAKGVEDLQAGRYTELNSDEDLKNLAEDIIRRGRERLAKPKE